MFYLLLALHILAQIHTTPVRHQGAAARLAGQPRLQRQGGG
jgi:hypothetical protein